MKVWIRIVEDGQPVDGAGLSMRVNYNLVPTEDRRGLRWELAEPIKAGFHITRASEFWPIEVRAGGEGN